MLNAQHSLEDWLEFIAQSHPSEIELGLDRVKSVYEKMEFKGRPGKVVVVAGTNGKGSTIALSSACLSALGLRCGAYTSPHILKYNERVQVLGKDVSDQSLVEAFHYIDQVRQDTALTYFEFGTLAALYILFNAELDIVFLEIGLGGRLDAVNIVDGDISIITSIGVDHVDWLGDDIQKIGLEKAGILRPGQRFLAGESLPESIFSQSDSLKSRVLECRKDFDVEASSFYLSDGELGKKRFPDFPVLSLPENNILLALQLVYLIAGERSFDMQKVSQAMSSVKLAGRLEQSAKVPNLYYDVGHNPHAAKFLATFLQKKRAEGFNVVAVYSALGDKDILGVVEQLKNAVDQWLLAPLSAERAVDGATLEGLVRKVSANVKRFGTVGGAIDFALKKNEMHEEISTTGNGTLVLVFGSFFTVEAAKKYLDSYE